MPRSKWLALGATTLLALGVGTAALPARKSEGAPPGPAKVFAGKLLLVLAKDGVAVTLERPEVRQVGGRAFVVGKEAKGSPYSRERFGGAPVWMPVESVTQLVELEGLGPGK